MAQRLDRSLGQSLRDAQRRKLNFCSIICTVAGMGGPRHPSAVSQVNDYHGFRRDMWRITLRGEKPLGVNESIGDEW